MKFDKYVTAVSGLFLLTATSVLADSGEAGLWHYADRTVYQVDPSSSLGQLMAKNGGKGMPDKSDSFDICFTPKEAQVLLTNPKTINPLMANTMGCTIQNEQHSGSSLSYDMQCKSVHIHMERSWSDSRHMLETIKSDMGNLGVMTTMTRAANWVKAADCSKEKPTSK